MNQETWDYVNSQILNKVKTDKQRLDLYQTMLTVKVKRAKLYDRLIQDKHFKTLPDAKKKLLKDMAEWIRSSGRT